MKTPMPSDRLTLHGTCCTIATSAGLVTRLKHITANRTLIEGAGFVKAYGRCDGQPYRGKPSLRPVSLDKGFFLAATRQGALANGADISRTQERQRCGTTHRSESALIERPTQAWLNVTHRSSHPEESIRQAHLVWEGQMNPPDGAGRELPVTRWRYA